MYIHIMNKVPICTCTCIYLPSTCQEQALPTSDEVTTSSTATSTLVPIDPNQSMTGVIAQAGTALSPGHSSASQGGGVGGTGGGVQQQQVLPPGVGGNDQQILKPHELALQRLEELQGDMIGGEKGGMPVGWLV